MDKFHHDMLHLLGDLKTVVDKIMQLVDDEYKDNKEVKEDDRA